MLEIIDVIEDGYGIRKREWESIFCKKWNIW